MTLPSASTKLHLDSETDDPRQARAELATLVDNVNTIRTHLLSGGLTSGTSVLGIGDGLESSGGSLRAKLNGATIDRSASGLALADDAVSLAKMAHQAGLGLLYFDASGVPTFISAAGAGGQVLKVLDGSPNGFEFAAATSGGWAPIVTKSGGATTIEFLAGTDFTVASNNAYKFKINKLFPSADREARIELKLATSGWTVADAAASPFRWGYGQSTDAAAGTFNGGANPASNFIPISLGNSLDNVEASALGGVIDFFGVNDQANTLQFNGQVNYRDSAGNHHGGYLNGQMREDVTIEEVVGFRFYLNGAGSFDAASTIQMYGQSFGAS